MQSTQAEYELFLEWQRSRQSARQSVHGPDPSHRGVVDAGYVRPPASDFPKMAYRKSASDPKGYTTRIVYSAQEEAALPKGWITATKDVHTLLEGIVKEKTAGVVEAA